MMDRAFREALRSCCARERTTLIATPGREYMTFCNMVVSVEFAPEQQVLSKGVCARPCQNRCAFRGF